MAGKTAEGWPRNRTGVRGLFLYTAILKLVKPQPFDSKIKPKAAAPSRGLRPRSGDASSRNAERRFNRFAFLALKALIRLSIRVSHQPAAVKRCAFDA